MGGFWLWGLALGSENLGELPGLINDGAVAIKLFLGYALDRTTRQLVYNIKDREAREIIAPASMGRS